MTNIAMHWLTNLQLVGLHPWFDICGVFDNTCVGALTWVWLFLCLHNFCICVVANTVGMAYDAHTCVLLFVCCLLVVCVYAHFCKSVYANTFVTWTHTCMCSHISFVVFADFHLSRVNHMPNSKIFVNSYIFLRFRFRWIASKKTFLEGWMFFPFH